MGRALVAATAAHAGFQLTVTALVYPALGALPPTAWAEGHARHSRRIVPLVAVLYAAVVAGSAVEVARRRSPAVLVSAAASAVALGTTAFVAAPLHGRLGSPRDAVIFARLQRADQARCLAATVALASALAAP